MKKRIYLLLGLCLALAVFMPNTAKEVQAADGVLGDLTGDSAVTTDDKTAFENYLLGIVNETTTENIANANVNGVEDATTGAVTDVRDLVRYERYLYLDDIKTNASSYSLTLEDTSASMSTSNRYQIATVKDLYCLATNCTQYGFGASGTTTYYFEMADDIEMNVGTGEPSTWNESTQLLVSWTPMGKDNTISDKFDGVNHTISGVYCNETSSNNVGLFAQSTNGNTEIKNIKFEQSCFISTKACTGPCVGKITGGVLENIYVADTVYVQSSSTSVGGVGGEIGVSAQGLYSAARIVSTSTSTTACVGGIAGMMSNTTATTLQQCQFTGTISAKGTYCGGIVGRTGTGSSASTHTTSKTIKSCLFSGTITNEKSSSPYVGGIAGGTYIYATGGAVIQDCLSVGTITVSSATGSGSIVGYLPVTATIDDVYSTCTVSPSSESITLTFDADGIGTVASGVTVTGTVNEYESGYLNGYGGYRLTGLPFVDGATEYDVDNTTSSSAVWVAKEDSYPELDAWTDEATNLTLNELMSKADISWYDNTAYTENGNYYLLDTVEDLWGLNIIVQQSEETPEFGRDGNRKTFKLGADITFASNEEWVDEWTPLYAGMKDANKGFFGYFDGDGHSICNMVITSTSDYTGFIADTRLGSAVQNLKLLESSITGGKWVGSIVGICSGDIKNVYSNAEVVSSGDYCGGITGYYSGSGTQTIENVVFDGHVESAGAYCGGIVGRIAMATKTLTNCINSGTVTGTRSGMTNNFVGGICGAVQSTTSASVSVTFTNCINSGTIYVSQKIGGVGSIVGFVNKANDTTTYTATLISDNIYTTDSIYLKSGEDYTQIQGDDLTQLYTDSDSNVTLGVNRWLRLSSGSNVYSNGTVTVTDDTVLALLSADTQKPSESDNTYLIPTTDFTWSVSDDDTDGIYTVTYSAVEATE